ncbi:tetratricopeptide repeat protein [Microtetraspora malaysiensis]|uniref:tetratricopeptide repeat protein n=1 Tax=Microtetraspora malaysiensis TaxID=161358 RepID=UPI003D89EDC8
MAKRDEPPTVEASNRAVGAAGNITAPVTTGDHSPIDNRRTVLGPGVLLGPWQVEVTAPVRRIQERRTDAFVGREQALAELEQMLAAPSDHVVIRQVVHGMGGVGKSELARHYAHTHWDRYRLVWWITADSYGAVQQGLAGLAAAVHPPVGQVGDVEQAADWALSWLQAHSGWLLILDNVEAPDDVRPWLDRLSGGRVLLTTRRDVYWPGTRSIALDVLDPAAAVELITEVSGRTDPADRADVVAIAAELERLPLALEQAAAYMRISRKSPASYLRMLREHPAQAHARSAAGGEAERTMARLWDTHLAAIQAHDAAEDLGAEHLLRTLACYAPDNIPRVLLSDDPDAEDLDCEDALALLASYSMITRSGEDEREMVSMHRLFQSVIRNGLDPADPRQQSARQSALSRLSRSLPDNPQTDVNGWPLWRDLSPHVDAIAARYQQGSGPGELGTVLNRAAIFAMAQARHRHAYQLAERALATIEAAYGPDHPIVATCLGSLASSLSALGRVGEAVPLAERALAITEVAYGPDHPDVATCLGNLAVSLSTLGRVGEAVPLEERALAITEVAYGPDHPDVATRLGNLAASLYALGRAGEAVPLEERALAITQAAYGPDHPTVATRLGNLAASLYALGRAGEAVPLEERALAITQAAYGPDHPTVATRLGNLAAILYALGRVGEAVPLLERALAITQAAYGPDHPDVATRLGNLAAILYALGRVGEAVPLEERALAITQAAYGPDHPDVAIRLGNLAASLYTLGRAGEAVPLLERALAVTEAAYGPDHPTVAIRLGNLAASLYTLGRAGEAVPLLERALTVTEAAYGPDHPQSKILRENLSNAVQQ